MKMKYDGRKMNSNKLLEAALREVILDENCIDIREGRMDAALISP